MMYAGESVEEDRNKECTEKAIMLTQDELPNLESDFLFLFIFWFVYLF